MSVVEEADRLACRLDADESRLRRPFESHCVGAAYPLIHVSIEVQEDLAVDSFVRGTTEAIASRRLTEFLTNYFDVE